VLKYVASLILLTVFSLPAAGQEIPVSIDPTRRQTTTQPDFSEEYPEISLNDPFELDLGEISRYDQHFPDYWTNYARAPHVEHVYRYRGLHGLIYKHVIKAVSRFYEDALHNTWDTSHLSIHDLGKLQQRYALRASDPRHPWWDRRYFFDHFSIAKGGASVETVTIGNTYDVLSLGPLNLTNSGRVSWSGWRLSIAQDEELSSRGFNKNLDGTDERKSIEERRNDPNNYSFGISPPRGNLYTGDVWSVSGGLRLGLKGDTIVDNKSSITGSIKIIGHYRHRPWLAINVKAKAQPISGDYGVQMTIALLTF
jgi:hypothetical protein